MAIEGIQDDGAIRNRWDVGANVKPEENKDEDAKKPKVGWADGYNTTQLGGLLNGQIPHKTAATAADN